MKYFFALLCFCFIAIISLAQDKKETRITANVKDRRFFIKHTHKALKSFKYLYVKHHFSHRYVKSLDSVLTVYMSSEGDSLDNRRFISKGIFYYNPDLGKSIISFSPI